MTDNLYDVPPTPQRSRNMAANRGRDTAPELAVRTLVHAAGLRYRVDLPIIIDGRRIRPDIVFTRARIAVFIDGCFWHCCPKHVSYPATNTRYWSPKLQANIERDRLHTEMLLSFGWEVLRFWEHENPGEVAANVIRAVKAAA